MIAQRAGKQPESDALATEAGRGDAEVRAFTDALRAGDLERARRVAK